MTSMPSTSHSDDLARRRWICSRRCSPASSGSSRSLTLALGFALLKLSTTVPNAPLVSLPMHQVTLPDALACVAFSALGVPPLSSPPPPQPAMAKRAVPMSAARVRGLLITAFPFCCGTRPRYPLSSGVNPFADLLGHLVAEGGEVVRLAARDEPVVHHDLLVDPVPARVFDVG